MQLVSKLENSTKLLNSQSGKCFNYAQKLYRLGERARVLMAGPVGSFSLVRVPVSICGAREQFENTKKLNSKSSEIQKAILGKLDNIFMQRYPVYYMKDDAVRFGPSLSEMSAVQNYVSPNAVRKWRETANEQLADIKRDIASLPDRPSNPGKFS